jgi:hypothetical protein
MDDMYSPPPPRDDSAGVTNGQLLHAPVGARIPDRIAPGAAANGVVVLEGPDEFIVDFVQNLARPPRLMARVVMTHRVMAQFVEALRDNLSKFEQRFGPPKPMPAPPPDHKPNIREFYDELRMSDDLLSGAYATSVIIGHSPAEFFFDFITRFYPKAAVSARVFVAASQAPGMLATLSASSQRAGQRPNPPQPAAPPPQPPDTLP